ncbi:hypothetical protein AALK46_12620 [Staphylococcus nepalensis]|uniref:hypothetical protein n=1 Tax=Staphylococcus TaxID=1279 RepID=UPI002DB5F35C|nr:hypothetical protein [Staphylococcus pseudoxylosus]MEB6038183.1 hypothetical protein [Staphylococcus pseudoxylosus]
MDKREGTINMYQIYENKDNPTVKKDVDGTPLHQPLSDFAKWALPRLIIDPKRTHRKEIKAILDSNEIDEELFYKWLYYWKENMKDS